MPGAAPVSTHPRIMTSAATGKTISPSDYEQFHVFLERNCGIMLGDNKHYLISSRLHHLLAEYAVSSLGELVKRAEQGSHSGLQERIIDAMTTNETLWFRDIQPYEALKHQILPELAQRQGCAPRIWSAACSSGQEPYSISMVVQEYLQNKPGAFPRGVQIIATDISPTMLKEAAAGVYDGISLSRGLSLERRERFFTSKAGDASAKRLGMEKWEIKKEIKNRVTFKELNLMKSYAALGKFDVIFCRNVLIYFSGALKRDIIARLTQTLNPHGYLILGASESLANHSDAFDMLRYASTVVYRLKTESK